MRAFIGVAALLIASVLTVPAWGQGMGGGYGGGYGGPNGGNGNTGGGDFAPSRNPSSLDDHKHYDIPNDPEGIAEDLRLKGHCDKAVPILRRLSDRGSGYELSQFNLGLCLFDLAKAQTDATQASAMTKEGAEWILTAANAGLGRAQEEAVVLYLDGTGVAADPVEAGKWAFLFHDNGTRLVLGLPDIAPTLHDRLDAALSGAQRKQAHARADSWVQTGQAFDN